jgi:hypothetical protein
VPHDPAPLDLDQLQEGAVDGADAPAGVDDQDAIGQLLQDRLLGCTEDLDVKVARNLG